MNEEYRSPGIWMMPMLLLALMFAVVPFIIIYIYRFFKWMLKGLTWGRAMVLFGVLFASVFMWAWHTPMLNYIR